MSRMVELVKKSLETAREIEALDTERDNKMNAVLVEMAKMGDKVPEHLQMLTADGGIAQIGAKVLPDAGNVRNMVLLLAKIEKSEMNPDICALASEMKKLVIDYACGR